ncbi:hypothetical protein [Kaistella carnis]|uniref:DUF4280 domain-containing protein n=1 Tax=Kaistella carnis TaxID=1241979 RepID=A0A3G8XJ90_9FLAO|nr:hypothetical protein [Kaistella carnis]AZI33139.1 hypothetical protein EIB73_08110 [Kaistella carnis]
MCDKGTTFPNFKVTSHQKHYWNDAEGQADYLAVTEASELRCSIGGKITVMKHGQQSEAGKSNAANANPKEQEIYNPVVDYDEFQEEVNPDDFEVE